MIRIVTLLENTKQSSKLKSKHGLSLYIETQKHKLLFDMGPNDLFLKNAEKLGVDIASVDIAVISHGHVDHCGGLGYFLQKNSRAKIYIRPQAVESHYVKVFGIPFYAGIDRSQVVNDRFVFTDEVEKIDDEITLFSDVFGDFPLPTSDNNLFMKKDGVLTADDFRHEQNLLVADGDNRVLFCGCAHAGIVNIVNRAEEVCRGVRTVIGGMHLYEPTKKRYESEDYIDSVALRLSEGDRTFYTCHCTGERAYAKMKNRLGVRLFYLRTGAEILL